jgi:class 3 adenylate cyclase
VAAERDTLMASQSDLSLAARGDRRALTGLGWLISLPMAYLPCAARTLFSWASSRCVGLIHHREAERRQITALCCELAGAAPGGDGVGLEDRREAVGGFQRCVSETVDRHQGFVYRDLGNSALVLFGYPEAHEQDAEQAIRAGVELCAAVRSLRPEVDAPVRCRVGIATGVVIVGDPVEVGAARGEGIVG